MKHLLLFTLLSPAIALWLMPCVSLGQAQTVEQGCYLEFSTGQCQESLEALWIDYGKEPNTQVYGAPVASLLNQAVADRKLLLKWVKWSEHLEKRNKKLKASVRRRPSSCEYADACR